MDWRLWFDVKLKRYSPAIRNWRDMSELWFDVKLKRYSPDGRNDEPNDRLWFDVKLKRYSPTLLLEQLSIRCGLM